MLLENPELKDIWNLDKIIKNLLVLNPEIKADKDFKINLKNRLLSVQEYKINHENPVKKYLWFLLPVFCLPLAVFWIYFYVDTDVDKQIEDNSVEILDNIPLPVSDNQVLFKSEISDPEQIPEINNKKELNIRQVVNDSDQLYKKSTLDLNETKNIQTKTSDIIRDDTNENQINSLNIESIDNKPRIDISDINLKKWISEEENISIDKLSDNFFLEVSWEILSDESDTEYSDEPEIESFWLSDEIPEWASFLSLMSIPFEEIWNNEIKYLISNWCLKIIVDKKWNTCEINDNKSDFDKNCSYKELLEKLDVPVCKK